ncbi:MAG TPA: DUF2934 domain-containing protein [Steroidobacteraceae bacterium]|nr:DUF2934 domain-containing protein [Steroidobacteraceae bacterium]
MGTSKDAGSKDRSSQTPPAQSNRAPAAGGSIASGEPRESRIALAAYYRAQARGFAPGFEVEDWLAAEMQIDATSGDANTEIEGVGGGMDAQPKGSAPRIDH